MRNILLSLIPKDKRDKNGKYAEAGIKGKMNHLKRWLRYKVVNHYGR